jgi:hypothetical protein
MSPWQKSTSNPASIIVRAVVSPAALMPVNATAAPSLHNSSTVARPMPDEPPVTMATFPLKRSIAFRKVPLPAFALNYQPSLQKGGL